MMKEILNKLTDEEFSYLKRKCEESNLSFILLHGVMFEEEGKTLHEFNKFLDNLFEESKTEVE